MCGKVPNLVIPTMADHFTLTPLYPLQSMIHYQRLTLSCLNKGFDVRSSHSADITWMQHKARPRELRATDVTSRRQIGRTAGVSSIRFLRLTVTNYIYGRARLYFHLCSSRLVDPPPIETELRAAGTRTKAESKNKPAALLPPLPRLTSTANGG